MGNALAEDIGTKISHLYTYSSPDVDGEIAVRIADTSSYKNMVSYTLNILWRDTGWLLQPVSLLCVAAA